MDLTGYFSSLLQKLETSAEIGNNGKDKDGFFLPTRTLLVRHLNLLRDLHAKPAARPMVRDSWKFVVEHLPPDWLVLTPDQKAALKKILEGS